MVIYSLLLIILMITRPQGLLGSTATFKNWRKRFTKATDSPTTTTTANASTAAQTDRSLGGENPR
jgi:hypothetical protein